MSAQRRPSPSGLTAVEIDLLRAVQECTAAVDGPYAPSTDVLELVDARTGVGPRYAQQILADLTAGWVRHLPLLDGGGNFGSICGDGPADAQYTEVRLTSVGELALASEAGAIGPLPFDLIEGSLYRGGGLPPFDPALTIRALLAGADSPGPPKTPVGTITTDPTGPFRRSRRRAQRYQLGSVFRRGPNPYELVLTEPPYLVGTDTIVASLQDRLEQARLNAEAPDLGLPLDQPTVETLKTVPVRSVLNMTSGRTGPWILLQLRKDVDLIDALDWVRSVWPVTVHVDCFPDEEIYDRFALWDGADQSGLRALNELLHPPDAGED
ncbi:hypothetical protein BA895_17640 [Humibacillus sp. DSM 29435]|uniref:hypothetical protein n=1 Tax=Humibacillus sp. DSM 29435 TaxID=1869167 RepID=UPI0008726D9A|nr:hypothetical protein [Humibacillus sp. DSM 29435]OFE17255.1 hypothetical protein BA895_17640 [Humibacillus sp. DSM 29435]